MASVAVHAALAAFVHAYEPAPRPAPELPPIAIEIVPVPAPAPPAVALAEPTPPPPPPEELATLPAPPRRAAGSTGAEPTPGPRSPWFDLRRRSPAVDLRLPASARDDLDRVPRGTDAAAAVPRTGRLRDAGGGNLRSDQGPFTADVAPDGSVTLADRRNVRVKLALPSPRTIANAISRWYYSDKGPDGKRGERTLENEVGGSIDPEDRTPTAIIPILRGGFDVTDALMRRKRIDPYASKKLAFLDATRDERVQLGAAHRAQQLRQTTQIMQRNLDRLWQRVTDPRARREALFELWDEVAETGDADIVEAGRAARKLVIGFIRARLPAGGPDAYSAAELAALNRRRPSKTPFAPYD